MTRYLCLLIAVLPLACPALAAPPLSEAEQAQLATAADFSPELDEGALYPLLANALKWEDGDAWAVVPAWGDVLAEPAAHRGEVMLVEGVFAGRQRRYQVARPGGWGEELTEWGIITDAGQDQVVLVYFVDPQGKITPPKEGTPVRVPARFYKVWRTENLNKQPVNFPVLVGPMPGPGGVAAAPASGSDSGTNTLGLFLGVVVLLLGGVIVLKRMIKPKPLEPGSRKLRRREALIRARQATGDEDGADDDSASNLPASADDALAELSKRKDE